MQTSLEPERWLSVDDIAIHLGVSRESIYRWAEKGKMPAYKLGRQWKFKASEVDFWLQNKDQSQENKKEVKC